MTTALALPHDQRADPRDDLHRDLHGWLATHADALNDDAAQAARVLPALARGGVLGAGVPQALGGAGGGIADAVQAIAAVAEQSVTAAFVFWGHRAFTEYLLVSANPAPRERWLPALLRGQLAGATGLSNAMKFLSRIESLQLDAQPRDSGWQVDGRLPWVTNLRPDGFVVAAAVQRPAGQAPAVVALESAQSGVLRSPDLNLIALRASNTAAIEVRGAQVPASALLADDGPQYLRGVRPHFLGMQCGLSIGLARAALAAASASGGARKVLAPRLAAARQALDATVAGLLAGLQDQRYVAQPAPLFRLRIALAGLAQEAVQIELQATGGNAYLHDRAPGFGRRWAEAAFIPVVTPSLTQLQGELDQQAARENAPPEPPAQAAQAAQATPVPVALAP